MKKAYICQTIMQYNDYAEINKICEKRLILPTLIDITDSDVEPQNVEPFYYDSFFSSELGRQLLEIAPDKLKDEQNKGRIKIAGYVNLNNQVSKVTEINAGNLDTNPGGFYLTKGILWLKKEKYCNIDYENLEVIKQLTKK